jgi:Glyoxalase-like domain
MPWLHAVLDVPAELYQAEADFWASALAWPTGPPWTGHPELRSFEPATGASYVHLQVAETSPRVHLDIESTDRDGTSATAIDLGADPVHSTDRWQSLVSPGGLPFCVVPVHRDPVPEPVRWPDGHRTRLVQVCIDSPPRAHDREVEFWRALLGGRFVASTASEFAGKWHDDLGSPLQLLFQRRDHGEGPVGAHLDLGTDDQITEVQRLIDIGADDLGRGHGGWHVLRDPTGQLFCVTENAPDEGILRDLG